MGLVVKMEKGNTASINGTRGGVVHAEVTSKHTSGKYHEEKQVKRELKQSNKSMKSNFLHTYIYIYEEGYLLFLKF